MTKVQSKMEFLVQGDARIKSLLRSVLNSHQLVSVGLDNTDICSISVINDISSDGQTFLLDQVRDPVVNRKISEGHSFSLATTLEGVEVSVERLRINSVVGEIENQSYEVNLPERVYYFQRRQAYRAQVSGRAQISTSVEVPASKDGSETGGAFSCDLLNISTTGCSISMSEVDGNRVVENDGCVSINLDLAEFGEHLELTALVRHYRNSKKSSKYFIGLEFQKMSTATGHRIGQLIAQLQMANRRAS